MRDAFDADDAEYDRGLLDTALSALDDKGFIEASEASDLGLLGLLEELFGDGVEERILDRAELFDNLLDTYGGEPSTEDLEEAKGHLESILAGLHKEEKKYDQGQASLFSTSTD